MQKFSLMSYNHSYVNNYHKCDLNQRFFLVLNQRGKKLFCIQERHLMMEKRTSSKIFSHLASHFIALRARLPHDHSALVKK